jgi:cysteine desulfurase
MDSSPLIYLDNHASTPVDQRVVEAMLPYWTEVPGNPASWHGFGKAAAEAVERARGQVAGLMGADPMGVFFTSGATESVNLALKGVMGFYSGKGRHVITSKIEHPVVLDTCEILEKAGAKVTRLPVDAKGRVDPVDLETAITPGTVLVSLIHGNNEVGTVQDLEALGAITRKHGVFLHVDASQSFGKMPIDVGELPVDLLSATAHKLYGPKGVGCLYLRRKDPRVRLVSQMHGGGHEKGIRSGTLNVPGIVGFGKACELAGLEIEGNGRKVSGLRDELWELLKEANPGISRNGDPDNCLPGNLNFQIPGVDSMALLAKVPDIAMSAGSACTSAIPAPSHVLRAIGLSPEEAASCIRVGVGKFNTQEEIREAARIISGAILELGANSMSEGLPESCLLDI